MLSNDFHKLFIHVDGKHYEVKAVCQTDAEANDFIASHPDTAVIDTDKHGNIYVAKTTVDFL